ncbi:MAG: hypothetical protein DI628_07275 [Blastochloris viridis]|uniref:Motility protein B-like N-terminal domain-containing protein n=1 Tax=Blastochloris viridis TaxID=1079 RepID=A0A6N4RBT1_BLAVI|nr:MAG: hypothetical protein DI628_07275 [Blastochloris viridis]
MTALVPRSLKAVSNGDSALIMWLSLNLILLVFFMLLNSMAQPGKPHPDAELMASNEAMAETRTEAPEGQAVPTAPHTAWREDVITRLRGTVMNRMQLRVLPQGSNANELRVEVPLNEVFQENGTLRRPEFVAKLRAAAGADSTLAWGLQAPYDAKGLFAGYMATLSRMTGSAVAWQDSEERVLQVQVRPGALTGSAMGSAIQNLTDDVNGDTRGVDAGGVR